MSPSIGSFGTAKRGGLTHYETAFVDEQRALGRGWQTIASMLRRPVEDVRAICDPDWSKS